MNKWTNHCKIVSSVYMTSHMPCVICSSVPAVSVTPFAAEWLVPFRLSKDFLNEAMAPVFVPAASKHPSEQTVVGAAD